MYVFVNYFDFIWQHIILMYLQCPWILTALNYKLLSYKVLSITEIILFMLVHDLDKNIFLFSGTKRVFLGKSTHLLYITCAIS